MSEVTERETTRKVSAHRDPSMDDRRQRDVIVLRIDIPARAELRPRKIGVKTG